MPEAREAIRQLQEQRRGEEIPDLDRTGSLLYTGGSQQIYGGTSVSAPSFAGLTALLNQQLGSGGVGNINPNLYSLAQAGWASGLFHDITTGTNVVTTACSKRSHPPSKAASWTASR